MYYPTLVERTHAKTCARARAEQICMGMGFRHEVPLWSWKEWQLFAFQRGKDRHQTILNTDFTIYIPALNS